MFLSSSFITLITLLYRAAVGHTWLFIAACKQCFHSAIQDEVQALQCVAHCAGHCVHPAADQLLTDWLACRAVGQVPPATLPPPLPKRKK
jgi:hypothetical protein